MPGTEESAFSLEDGNPKKSGFFAALRMTPSLRERFYSCGAGRGERKNKTSSKTPGVRPIRIGLSMGTKQQKGENQYAVLVLQGMWTTFLGSFRPGPGSLDLPSFPTTDCLQTELPRIPIEPRDSRRQKSGVRSQNGPKPKRGMGSSRSVRNGLPRIPRKPREPSRPNLPFDKGDQE